VLATLLFAITVSVFAIGGTNAFVNYDDPDYVTANPHVRDGLTSGTARWALTANAASNWHPLTWLSHALDVSLFGMSPAGHHATSIVLHGLAAAAAFVALRRLTTRTGLSFAVALLFAIHPLRAESVAWVSERKDVLSGCFFFLTLWAYARYADPIRAATPFGASSRRGTESPPYPHAVARVDASYYVAALVFFALGLLAKPMLVTTPCVLLLLDYWPVRRLDASTWVKRVVEKLPFFALSGASSVITYLVQKQGGAVTDQLPWSGRLGNALVAIPRYLGKVAWPSRLSALYPHPGFWPSALVCAGAAAVIAITALVWWTRKSRPWLLVGWFWFVGMLVPVIGLVQVGLQSIADRYTYLPAVGLGLAALFTLDELVGAKRASIVVCVGIALPLAVATVHQVTVWRKSLTLFTQAIAVAGDGNYLAYDNRGIAWADRGQLDAAMADYEHALAIKPDYSNAHNNYGLALSKLGRIEEAIAQYRAAVREKPSELEAHNNLANALSDAGHLDDALAEFRYVLARLPDHVNALNGEAVIAAQRGDLATAERQFKHVLTLDPSNLGALTNLGNVYAMTGRRDDAVRLFSAALVRKPDDPVVLFNLGQLYLQGGQPAAAAEKLEQAARLNPTNPDNHLALATALAELGRRPQALSEVELSLRLRPGYAPAQSLARQLEQAR
jgi:tetratricopeptide (TPR) repeat protein